LRAYCAHDTYHCPVGLRDIQDDRASIENRCLGGIRDFWNGLDVEDFCFGFGGLICHHTHFESFDHVEGNYQGSNSAVALQKHQN
jgi:hypothetical protein